jgi:putative SOS response-associated peptidase YedK
MCGRFTLTTPAEQLAQAFGLPEPPPVKPRYNVAPSQLVAVVGLKPDGKTRGLALLRWGFVPHWANDPDSGPRPINARGETVSMKPPFDHAFRDKRCLIPADGFFEWAAVGGKKVAHHLRLRGGGPMAFAGIWDVWRAEGHPTVLSCAVITVPANDLVRPFHERMPAVLRPDVYDRWLDNGTPEQELLGMLAPLPAEMMETVRVGPAVNTVANDGPECIVPAA